MAISRYNASVCDYTESYGLYQEIATDFALATTTLP